MRVGAVAWPEACLIAVCTQGCSILLLMPVASWPLMLTTPPQWYEHGVFALIRHLVLPSVEVCVCARVRRNG